MTDKVRENRVRRAAQRQGLALVKSRRRDPQATGFGTYGLVHNGAWVLADVSDGYGYDLAAIEEWLAAPKARRTR